jgi:hypothetical protein
MFKVKSTNLTSPSDPITPSFPFGTTSASTHNSILFVGFDLPPSLRVRIAVTTRRGRGECGTKAHDGMRQPTYEPRKATFSRRLGSERYRRLGEQARSQQHSW